MRFWQHLDVDAYSCASFGNSLAHRLYAGFYFRHCCCGRLERIPGGSCSYLLIPIKLAYGSFALCMRPGHTTEG